MVIKVAIRFQDNTVVVFDRNGEQPPQYQGQYDDVKDRIKSDAPPEVVFAYGFEGSAELKKIPKEEW